MNISKLADLIDGKRVTKASVIKKTGISRPKSYHNSRLKPAVSVVARNFTRLPAHRRCEAIPHSPGSKHFIPEIKDLWISVFVSYFHVGMSEKICNFAGRKTFRLFFRIR